MRYLLAAIDQLASSQRSKELKAILAEAREGADEKNASQEFYETLERIVNELRGWTEHSVPFLQKVRKAEAPNYYDVIKRPMDLGTVLKKVKGQQYKDKKSFSDDLDLIWSNCLEYNTLPEHPLRRSAMMLKNKSHQLLQFVNDIVRPTGLLTPGRETPDADGDSDYDIEPDDTGATRKGMISRKRGAQGAKSRARSEGGDGGSLADGEVDSERGRLSRSSSPASTRDRRDSTAPPVRRRLTTRTDLIPFEERPALLRTREGMSRFVAAELEPLGAVASTSALTLEMPLPTQTQATPSPLAKPLPLPVQQLGGRARVPLPKSEPMQPSLSEAPVVTDALKAWWEAAVGPELIANGVSSCHFVDGQPEAPLEPAFDVEESPLALKMAANLAILTQIRKRRQKLLSIPDDEMETSLPALSLPIAPVSSRFQHADAGDAACTAMRAVASILVAHAGFDAARDQVLTVFSSLMVNMLSNLGRTAQLLNDRMSQVLTAPRAQELLICTLRENGIDHPDLLPAYVDEHIHGYGDRLQQLLQHLSQSEPLSSTALEALDAANGDSPAARYFQAPPAYVALTEDAIESQIGLLQPLLRARAVTEHALHDDDNSPVKVKVFRPKVPPSGKIPTKRRAEKDSKDGIKKPKKAKKASIVSIPKPETDEGEEAV